MTSVLCFCTLQVSLHPSLVLYRACSVLQIQTRRGQWLLNFFWKYQEWWILSLRPSSSALRLFNCVLATSSFGCIFMLYLRYRWFLLVISMPVRYFWLFSDRMLLWWWELWDMTLCCKALSIIQYIDIRIPCSCVVTILHDILAYLNRFSEHFMVGILVVI